MTLSLQELAEARDELNRAFEQIWPDPNCPCPNPPPCFAELDALEQRYRRARRVLETGTGSAGLLLRESRSG